MMTRRHGMWYAVGAYLAWGVFPVYWRWLQAVPAPQVIAHRIVWSCAFLGIIVLATRQWTVLRNAFRTPRMLAMYGVAALLVGANWLTYVWGVNSGHVVETSLGYFINPLLSVLLGVVMFHERLRRAQWIPVALAGAGVLYLGIAYGAPPWIALILASTFAVYGGVKKKAPLGAVHGLALETVLLSPFALAALWAYQTAGQGGFGGHGFAVDLLLIGAGPVTTVPLLLFAAGVRRIPLAHMGILQYISPTLQFLCGVLLFGETFTTHRIIGFSLVWLALLIFAAEGVHAQRRRAAQLLEGETAPLQ